MKYQITLKNLSLGFFKFHVFSLNRLGHKIDVCGIREVAKFWRQLFVNLGCSPQRKWKPSYGKNTTTCKSVHVCYLNIKTCAPQYGLWWLVSCYTENRSAPHYPHTKFCTGKTRLKIQVYALVCQNTCFLLFLKKSNKLIKHHLQI